MHALLRKFAKVWYTEGVLSRLSNPELMATNTRTEKPEPVATALLEQLTELEAKSMSPETARKLLELHFSTAHQKRVDVLSEKARTGRLIQSEHEELGEFVRVADLLAVLQARARHALKLAGLSS